MKAIILAGGTGSRLWPISTEEMPKQFIKFTEKSFFQQAVDLIQDRVDHIFVVTHEKYVKLALRQIREFPVSARYSVIAEKGTKGTAPAIMKGVFEIIYQYGDDITIILPADHYIKDHVKLLNVIENTRSHMEDKPLVSFSRMPEEGDDLSQYGVFCLDSDWKTWLDRNSLNYGNFLPVLTFTEKPKEKELANIEKEIVKDGTLRINAGIFFGYASTFLSELMLYCPEILGAVSSPDYFYNNETVINMSFDRLVLGKSSCRTTVDITECGWSDMGTFDVFKRKFPEFIKKFVSEPGELSNNHTHEENHGTSSGQVHERPWGWYRIIGEGSGWKIKFIHVNPGEALSLQLHRKRNEYWTAVSGDGLVTLNGQNFYFFDGEGYDTVKILTNDRHRVVNNRTMPLEFIEIQKGEYLGEDDIIRLDDKYGRHLTGQDNL